ncbi:MAG: hypothetical protein CMI18_13750 [Opitutaceae bacterium]|nr:hypothetical protein [Opitutaceae bacterium]
MTNPKIPMHLYGLFVSITIGLFFAAELPYFVVRKQSIDPGHPPRCFYLFSLVFGCWVRR